MNFSVFVLKLLYLYIVNIHVLMLVNDARRLRFLVNVSLYLKLSVYHYLLSSMSSDFRCLRGSERRHVVGQRNMLMSLWTGNSCNPMRHNMQCVSRTVWLSDHFQNENLNAALASRTALSHVHHRTPGVACFCLSTHVVLWNQTDVPNVVNIHTVCCCLFKIKWSLLKSNFHNLPYKV